MSELNTIEDYVRFWQGQAEDVLKAIAREHGVKYPFGASHAELVGLLEAGMRACCHEHDREQDS